ncbi:MAG: zinc-dependent peptidase [Candidatus Omnitrophica bacterium]|nr:zinc-dependent peptidase [Candidatus Omnitrophota bacterium]
MGFAAAAAGIFTFFFIIQPLRKNRRRERLRAKPLPGEWGRIIQNYVPLYRCLPAPLQQELHGHIQVFLDEKYFEGCNGLEIDDVIRVCIAAQACILLLNRKTDYFPTLNAILVYPATYIAREKVAADGLIPLDDASIRLGESWKQGMVVLAWDHVKRGARNVRDGQNLVFHEFAHQLDEEDGAANGAPLLGSRSQYAAWRRVFKREYKKLRNTWAQDRRRVLDEYGATSPAEFFAVATEAFYEKPHQLKIKHPELFNEMRAYFKVDPTEWLSP